MVKLNAIVNEPLFKTGNTATLLFTEYMVKNDIFPRLYTFF